MSETETVLPCPFCGERASGDGKTRYSEDFAKEQGWGQSEFYFCNCPSCGVNNQGLRGYETREEAIAAWNRRAAEAKAVEVDLPDYLRFGEPDMFPPAQK